MKVSRSTLVTLVLVLAALALGHVITQRLPQPDDVASRPFVRAGELGQPITLRTGTLTVLSASVTHSVSQFGTTYTTPHGWLVVRVQYTAAGRTNTLTNPTIVAADGREFGGYQSVPTPCGPAQPDFTIACDLVVEVAQDALPGARLRLMADPLGGARTPDDVAEVDLRLTADGVAQSLAGASAIELAQGRELGAAR